MTPSCPDHGAAWMQSMEHVGAPSWFTCTAPTHGPGGVCGKSDSVEAMPPKISGER